MIRQKRIKRLAVPSPQDLNQAAEFIRLIGEKQRQIDKIQTALNAKIERLKAEALTAKNSKKQQLSQLNRPAIK